MSALLTDSMLLSRFNAIFEAAAKQVVGRDSLLTPIKLALLTRNHVLLIGKPGVAKSKLIKAIMGGFKCCETFRVQCTKRMSEEYLVGPLDMKLFRTRGEYRHLTEGSIVTAHLAFLDEFLDLPDQSLRALLEVLNERRFTRGKQREVCKLHTAFAATNFAPTDEQVEAVQDRFLFRSFVHPLDTEDEVKAMLTSSAQDAVPVRPMPFKWLRVMQRRVASVTVDPFLFDSFAKFCMGVKKQQGLAVTDRRIMWTLDAIRACAYLDGRDTAMPRDFLSAAEYTFMQHGDDKQGNLFSACVTTDYAPNMVPEDSYSTACTMEQVLRGLSIDVAMWQRDNSVDGAPILAELNDFVSACMNDPLLSEPRIGAKTAELVREAKRYVRIIEANDRKG